MFSMKLLNSRKDTFIKQKIERARYSGINEIWESTLIFHSVTGLYETRVNLSDLS